MREDYLDKGLTILHNPTSIEAAQIPSKSVITESYDPSDWNKVSKEYRQFLNRSAVRKNAIYEKIFQSMMNPKELEQFSKGKVNALNIPAGYESVRGDVHKKL